MSNEDMLANYYDMMKSIDPDSAESLKQLRNDPANNINNATIASWTKSAVGYAIQSGDSATVSSLKLMHDKALADTEFDEVSNEISSLYDCAYEFKKAEMNIETIAKISQERIEDDSLNKMESSLDNIYSSLKTAITRSFGMLSNPIKFLKNYLNNDVKPKLKDMIKNFSSKLKEDFIDMLQKVVKFFYQIFNEFVSKIFSFVEMIKGIAKSKGFGLKSVTVSFEPPGFGQMDIFGFSLPIPKISLPKVDINFEMGIENEIANVTTNQLLKDIDRKVLNLLLEGKIGEFNELRKKNASLKLFLSKSTLSSAALSYADLSYADLSYADLSYADLSYAALFYADLSYAALSKSNLSSANLSSANLSSANLSSAALSKSNLSYANLSYANLSSANLSSANLSSANLSSANLSSATLSKSNLSSANLSSADLSNSIIINSIYNDLKINNNTKFDNVIIDDSTFIDYIKQFTKWVPNKIENKRELKTKLEERKINEFSINEIISFSILND